jgi:hypothetical protein
LPPDGPAPDNRPTMADATLKLLRDLDDPRKYHRVEAVPVFTPHKLPKRDSAGQVVEVEVTEDDLHEIAEHCNRRADDSGTLAVVTLGHRLQGREVPETKQPRPVGYCRNWRVARFGPGKLPALFCDLHVRQEDKAEAGSYGFRSVEYYRGRNEITAVCLLRRDPELDLGVTAFQADEPVLCYSREVNMPDPTMPPDADAPMDAATPPMPGAEGGDEAGQMEAYQRHCASHPYARGHHEKMLNYAMEAAGSGGGDLPAPAPASMPAPAPMPGEGAEQFQRRLESVQYQRRLEVAEKRALAAEQKINLLTYERDLTQLLALGYEFDLAAELKECANLAPEQFSRHKSRIEKNYAKGPVGDRDPVRVATSAGPGPAKFTKADLDKCEEYMRQNVGCSWEQAEQYARGERALTGESLGRAA